MRNNAPRVEEAFDPGLRQSQRDLEAYWQTRPYYDEDGKLLSPDGREYDDPEDYFAGIQRQREVDSTTEPSEKTTLTALTKELAKADVYGNKAAFRYFSDALLDEMIAQSEKKKLSFSAETELIDATLDRLEAWTKHYAAEADTHRSKIKESQPQERVTVTNDDAKESAVQVRSPQAELRKYYEKLFIENPELVEGLAWAQHYYTSVAARRERQTFHLQYTKEETEEARQNYEQARLNAREVVLKRMEAAGATGEELALIRLLDDQNEAATTIFAQNLEASRLDKQSKFVSKWVEWSTQGSKGMLKKAAVVAGAGAATGLLAGFTLPALFGVAGGATAGAATGAAIGTRVSRGLFFGSMETRAQTALQREQEYGRRLVEQLNIVDNSNDVSVTGVLVEGVEMRVQQNRRRAVKAAGVAAITGAAAGTLGASLRSAITDRDMLIPPVPDSVEPEPPTLPELEEPPVEPDEQPPEEATPPEHEEPEPPEIEPMPVEVQPSDGFTHILHRDAAELGYHLTGAEVYRLYLEMVAAIGGDNIIDGIGTYTETVNGVTEYRIAAPGEAIWTQEAREFMQQWLEESDSSR